MLHLKFYLNSILPGWCRPALYSSKKIKKKNSSKIKEAP